MNNTIPHNPVGKSSKNMKYVDINNIINKYQLSKYILIILI